MSIYYKHVLITTIALYLCSLSESRAQDIDTVARLAALLPDASIGAFSSETYFSSPDKNLILGFVQKRGLVQFDVHAKRGQFVSNNLELDVYDGCNMSLTSGGTLMTFQGPADEWLICRYSPLIGIDNIRYSKLSKVARQDYSILSRDLFNEHSTDDGANWVRINEQFSLTSAVIGDSTLTLQRGIDGDFYVFISRDSLEVLRLPFKVGSSSPSIRAELPLVARYGRDSICYIGSYVEDGRMNTYLHKNQFGDSVPMRVDPAVMSYEVKKARPRFVVPLWGDSVLYVDDAGWMGVMNHGFIYETPLPFVPNAMVQWRGNVYVTRYDADSIRYARTNVDNFPRWQTWSTHIDFRRTSTTMPSGRQSFHGDFGTVLARSEEYGLLSSPLFRYPLSIGAMLGHLPNVTMRRTLSAWTDPFNTPVFLDDGGRLFRVEGERHAECTYPCLLFDNFTEISQWRPRPNSTLPWFGVRTPQPWQIGGTDTLAHCGSVVRRLLSRGDVQDTVWRGLTTAFARVDASTWSVANHDAVWVRTGADTLRHELRPLRTASGLLPGYPSSITPLNSGARYLLSFYGTTRSDSDFVPQPYRHGGLAVVDGTGAPTVVPLPAECGSYVYPVHRLSDGTLLALTAQMREDSSESGRQTPILSNVRYIRSTDGGASWTSSAPLFYTGEWIPCTGKIVDLGGGYMLGVMPASVVVSTDGGRTWDFDERVPASMRAIDIHRSGDDLLVAAHDGLYRVNTVTSVDGEQAPQRARREPVSMPRDAFRAHVSTLEAATVYDVGGRVLCTSQDCESIDRMPLPLGGVVMVVSTSERRMYYVE